MKALSKSVLILMTVVLLAAGIGFLCGGISLHKHTLNQNRTYTGTAEAAIVDYEVRQEEQTFTDADGFDRTEIVDMYFPIFSYTVDGQEYTVTSDSGSSDKKYEENSTVTISYLPSDPSQFYVSGEKSRNFLPYIMYAVSLVSALAAVKTFLDALKAR